MQMCSAMFAVRWFINLKIGRFASILCCPPMYGNMV